MYKDHYRDWDEHKYAHYQMNFLFLDDKILTYIVDEEASIKVYQCPLKYVRDENPGGDASCLSHWAIIWDLKDVLYPDQEETICNHNKSMSRMSFNLHCKNISDGNEYDHFGLKVFIKLIEEDILGCSDYTKEHGTRKVPKKRKKVSVGGLKG